MHIPILFGKSVAYASKQAKRSGSTWPGHVALKLDSQIVKKILKKNPNLQLVLIAGTNGKTTSAKMVQEALERNGQKVFRNSAGANLLNGVASSLLSHSNISGKIHFDTAVFEIDENSLPVIINEVQSVPNQISILLLNLFRDQLDRYGEVNTIAKNWTQTLKKLPKNTMLVTNGDDPMLRFIGQESGLQVFYFGISEKDMKTKDISSDVDFLYCPNCGTELEYKRRSYSHLGKFSCPKCKFKNDKTETFDSIPNPLLGLFNKYNINATATLLTHVFNITEVQIKEVIKNFSPAFGRQEKIEYNGKNVFLLLSKNPTGFNQSIQGVLDQDKNPNILLLLNDRIPDGRDVSWIWDVDFEDLKNAKKITVSGDRAYDMALRIKYANIKDFAVKDNLPGAIDSATSETPKGDVLYILATYSAMLEARKVLIGRSIL